MSDIEEEFYRVFGIEPRQMHIFTKDYNATITSGITDRILLELMCIIVSVQTSYAVNEGNYKKLKNKVLQKAISLKNYIAQDVKALFEGKG